MNKIDSFSGKYRWLSNFWLCPVVLEGYVYPTVENAYQAAKTINQIDRKPLLHCSPYVSTKIGRTQLIIRDDWEDVKLSVMRRLLEQKFQVGTFNSEKLISTANSMIIEGNTWHDTYWGVCNGEGQNNLGKLIMSIRRKLLFNTIH